MRITSLYLICLLMLPSCQSFNEAAKVLKNEKVQTTDEFLVKKKDPLVLPPDYKKIPEPGSIEQKKNNEEDKIKKILKAPKTKDISKKSSSVEQSILNEIRK